MPKRKIIHEQNNLLLQLPRDLLGLIFKWIENDKNIMTRICCLAKQTKNWNLLIIQISNRYFPYKRTFAKNITHLRITKNQKLPDLNQMSKLTCLMLEQRSTIRNIIPPLFALLLRVVHQPKFSFLQNVVHVKIKHMGISKSHLSEIIIHSDVLVSFLCDFRDLSIVISHAPNLAILEVPFARNLKSHINLKLQILCAFETKIKTAFLNPLSMIEYRTTSMEEKFPNLEKLICYSLEYFNNPNLHTFHWFECHNFEILGNTSFPHLTDFQLLCVEGYNLDTIDFNQFRSLERATFSLHIENCDFRPLSTLKSLRLCQCNIQNLNVPNQLLENLSIWQSYFNHGSIFRAQHIKSDYRGICFTNHEEITNLKLHDPFLESIHFPNLRVLKIILDDHNLDVLSQLCKNVVKLKISVLCDEKKLIDLIIALRFCLSIKDIVCKDYIPSKSDLLKIKKVCHCNFRLKK